MPPSKKNSSTTPATTVATQSAAPSVAPSVEKKPRATKTAATPAVSASVASTTPAVPVEKKPRVVKAKPVAEVETKTATAEPVEKKPRAKPTKESVLQNTTDFRLTLGKDIESLRSSDAKKTNSMAVKMIQQYQKQMLSHERELKRVLRMGRKAAGGDAERTTKPGFSKPVDVSPALRKLIDLADPKMKGKDVSRSDVVRLINVYIKAHNLQNPDDRRKILWSNDAVLKQIFSETVKPEDEFSYFTLNKYLKHHITKKPEVASVSA